VIVPGKNLQNQYKRDYESGKYILKDNGEKLKISVMTGRNNHECAFIKDKEFSIPEIKKEVNLKLFDIFESRKKEIEELKKERSPNLYSRAEHRPEEKKKTNCLRPHQNISGIEET
jgi:hypothetical protein